MKTVSSFRIGCQSWVYEDWVTQAGGRTVFYPRGTKSPDMLRVYAELFDTVEVDATAYGVPAATTVDGWYDKTPDDFVFALKVPSRITHELSLSAASYPIMDEFVDAARRLRRKLGVVLIQFPAAFEPTKSNAADLREFLARTPRDLRFAVEFRHAGWFTNWTFEELQATGTALALVAGKWVPPETMFGAFGSVKTDFAYLRFMGERDLQRFDRVARDRTPELELWAEKIGTLEARDVFIYVDNHFEGHAPATARKLQQMLGVPSFDPESAETQPSLF